MFWIQSDCHWRDRHFPWLSSLSQRIPEKCLTIDPARLFQNPHQRIPHHLKLFHLSLGYTTSNRHNWLTWKSINQNSVRFWWGTLQRNSPDHVPVHILATKESLRRYTPTRGWTIEARYVSGGLFKYCENPTIVTQAGELQCSVINRLAYVVDRGRERKGACLWQERFTVS